MKKICFRGIAILAFLLLLLSPGMTAQAAEIEYVSLENGDSFIVRPQLTEMADLQTQDRINAAIFDDGGYSAYMALMDSVTDSQTGIQVDAQANLLGDEDSAGLMTVLISAAGRIGPGRPGFRYTALLYDLTSGGRVGSEQLFKDTQEAVLTLTALIENEIEPQMSDYLSPEELYPVPLDNILLDEAGLTFFYDQSRFITLSGRSGAINFHFDELMDLLAAEEGSVPEALDLMNRPEDISSAIALWVSRGRLPGLPINLGESTDEVLIDYPPLFDSEVFPTGEKLQLEDARFRGSFVVSSDGRITDLISYRMNLFGLLTGQSKREDIISALGQPDANVLLDEGEALSYGLFRGQLLHYVFEEYSLHFNVDEQDVLQAIWLRQASYQ